MFFRLFALAALLMVTVVAGGRVHAQQQPSVEVMQAARELASIISINNAAQVTASINEQMWPILVAQLRQKYPSIDAATLSELRSEFEKLQVLTIMEANKDLPAIYARHFSLDEMRAMTTFYRTPTGMKAMAVMPQISVEVMKAMAPHIRDLQTKTEAMLAQVLASKGIVGK
jgi:hypothetical protein